MQDALLKQNENGMFDLVIGDYGDFESVEGLETSIVISLFTDARASSSEVSTPKYRRGWVGDITKIESGRKTGSLLWLLEQARLNQKTLNLAKIKAQECLQWMIDDGLARKVTASVSIVDNSTGSARIDIDIVAIDGTPKRYSYLWRKTDVSNVYYSV